MLQKVLLKLFDDGLKQTHQIRQVHPFLLSNLRFDKALYLSSVGLLAEEVCCIRNRFMLAYGKALIPLKAYAKEYDVHVALYTMDVNQYIQYVIFNIIIKKLTFICLYNVMYLVIMYFGLLEIFRD